MQTRVLTPKQVLNCTIFSFLLDIYIIQEDAVRSLYVLFDNSLYLFVALKKRRVTHVQNHAFIKEHFLGIGKDSIFLGWTVRYCLITVLVYLFRLFVLSKYLNVVIMSFT